MVPLTSMSLNDSIFEDVLGYSISQPELPRPRMCCFINCVGTESAQPIASSPMREVFTSCPAAISIEIL